MSEPDWSALAGEVGLPPPAAQPEEGGPDDPEIQRLTTELQRRVKPGAKFTLTFPAPGATALYPGTPTGSPAPATPTAATPPSHLDWSALGQEVGLPPPPAPPRSGGLDWSALAGEVGMPPPPPATPAEPGLLGRMFAGVGAHPGGEAAGVPYIPGETPGSLFKAGAEQFKVPATFTLQQPPESDTQAVEDAKTRAEIAGTPGAFAAPAEQPGFLHRVGSALHDYLVAELQSNAAPGNEAALADAKQRLSDEVANVARAGGTAWNGLVGMLQSGADVPQGLAEAIGHGAAAIGQSIQGKPAESAAELEKSRTAAGTAGEPLLGLARAPVDPWFYAATALAKKLGVPVSEEEAKKFGQMLDADPITTVLMMTPALHGVLKPREGVPSRAPEAAATAPPRPEPRPKPPTEQPAPAASLADRFAAEQRAADEAAWQRHLEWTKAEFERQGNEQAGPAQPPPPAPPERRAEATVAPRGDLEDLVGAAEAAPEGAAQQRAYGEARRAVWDEVDKRLGGRDPQYLMDVFNQSPRLQDLTERLTAIEDKMAEPEKAAAEARPPIPRLGEEPLPAQKAGEPGQQHPGAGAEEVPAGRATAPAPTLTAAGEQARAGGKPPIQFFTSDQPMPVTGEKPGTRVTEDVLRRNGLEPPGGPPHVIPTETGGPGETQAVREPGSPEHAVGEPLRYGKQRVKVQAVLRNDLGELVGYRVKGKRDLPFVIKAEEAVPWTAAPAPPENAPPSEIDVPALRARVEDLNQLEEVIPAGKAQPGVTAMDRGKTERHMAEERAAVDRILNDVEANQGKEAADRLRAEVGWQPAEAPFVPTARPKPTEAATEEPAPWNKSAGEGAPFYPNETEGTRHAAERPVPLEKNLKPKRPEAVVRAQDIKRRLEQAVLAPIRYGVGMKQALGFFRLAERVIRTKKYLDLPVDFHEAGHALQEILFPEIDLRKGKKGFDIKGPNSKAMRRELTALGKALYGKRKPVTGYKSEGLAEFTRLYIEDRAEAKAQAPAFFEEFKRRLLQDADTVDIGRVLDESREAYDRFRKQPAVAKALSRLSIGEAKPKRWTLDKLSSNLFDDQQFIGAMTKALNGGARPDFDLGNPITHAHLYRGWTGLAENALMRGGGVADFSTGGTFEKRGEGYADILARPGVADQPLPFVNEAVKEYENLSSAERLLKRFSNTFADAKNMRGLDTFRAYRYARRAISIAEGDVARDYARRANVSDAVALKYVQAHAGLVTEGKYREVGITYEEAKQVVKDLETPALAKAVDDATAWRNRLLHWYVEEGVWTEGQYRRVVDHPSNQAFMSLERWFSEYGERGASGLNSGAFTGARPDVKRLRGSDVPIIDPVETDISNAYMHAQMVQRNRALRMLVEYANARPGSGWAAELVGKPVTATKLRLAELKPQIDELVRKAGGDPSALTEQDYDTWGRVFRPAMQPKGGKNIATFFSEGKEKWVELDPDVYRAIAGLDQEAMPKFLKIFGAPARWLRAGATITPEFLLRNLGRDPITSAVLSETGTINPFTGSVPFVTTFRGMRELLKNGDPSFRMRASGGMHAAMVSLDRDYLRGQARALLEDHSTLQKLGGVILHPWETMRALGELGESGTRVGTFLADTANQLVTHDAILRASVKAREGTTDFGRSGTMMRPLAQGIAFFNPQIQSVRRFGVVTGRAVADIVKSVQAASQGEIRSPDYAARYASRVLTYVVAPSVVLHFLRRQMGRQDEYLELPAWRRHLFLNIPVPDSVSKTTGIRWTSLPKAFEVGVLYGTGTELLLERMEKEDPKALSEYEDSLVGAFTPSVIPAMISSSVENLANRKIAFDRPIMPASQAGLEARLQYGLYTSDTAKLAAAGARRLPSLVGMPVAYALKLSAHQENVNAYDIDNTIRNLTGGLGQYYVTPALDFVIRRLIGGTKEAERLGIGTAASTATRPSDLPVLRGFIPRENEKGAGLIERTYEDIGASEKAYATYLALDGWQRDEYLEDPEKRRLVTGYHVLTDVRAGLSAANKAILDARKSGDDDLVSHLRDLQVQMTRNAPTRIDEAMADPTAANALRIDWELAKMRNEAHARHAEAATVLESMVESHSTDDKVRGYLEGMGPEDRRWAAGYVKKLRQAQKLDAEREALKGASHREKMRLKQGGMLP